MSAIREAGSFDGLPARGRAILKHATKLTQSPSAVTPDDLDALRAEGLSDRDILDITLVTAYFNFVNRIALGLGVEYSEEELNGYNN